MIKTVENLDQARLLAKEQIAGYACRILVCSGTGCIATGSNRIHEIFEKLVKETPGIELVFSPCGGHHEEEKVVGVKKTGCQGFCELGPLVRIQKGDKVIQYIKVQPEDCEEIFKLSVLGDEILERLLYKKGEAVYVQPDEIPFIAKQTRIILEGADWFRSIGTEGSPYRKRQVNIISIAMDAPQDTISSLAGKVGALQGVSVKTAFSGAIYQK